MSRALFVILIGFGGAAILISLGIWQVQRLSWKEGILADINARIEAPAQALPARPDPNTDAYLPVEVIGALEDPPCACSCRRRTKARATA